MPMAGCHKSRGKYIVTGEVTFFAIHEKCRGKGLGRKLFQTVVDYMKSRGISAFYLFTDTSCNYPFYEHLGLTRRCEKKQVVDVKGEQGEMTFFLYDYPCEMAKPDGPVGVQEEGLL